MYRLAAVAVFLVPMLTSTSWAEDAPKIDFARQVLPILSNKCFVCHGPDAKEEDFLRLDSFTAATEDRGGYRAVDPQNPDKSEVIARLHDKEAPMPPEDAEKQLTDAERAILVAWVKQGGQYAKHWAFVPPQKSKPTSQLPLVIDGFLHDQMVAQKIDFAPQADRRTLARRAALVLTGLPPTPELLQEFLADSADDAYDKLVTKLLSSVHYGEHQARYWLDAVRYGDTHGLHLDNRRGIFPYRDWVIHALNENLPLDTFITWQLAGDLMPQPTIGQLVATGFVRMNPTTGEGGAIPAEFQAKNNFDRTETLGTVLLGMSLTCARCHTHKYDPIPQTEYYRLMAFFNSTAEHSMDRNAYTYGPTVKAPKDLAGWQAWTTLKSQEQKLLQQAEAMVEKLADSDTAKWRSADNSTKLELLTADKGPFAVWKLQQPAGAIRKQRADLTASFTTSLVAKELASPRVTKVLKRGEYNLPVGEALQPGILTVMGTFPTDAPRNRLGLAQWLTSREHPLVARVLINRIWQRVFGYGLVRTPEDFGLQGQQPTHPQLLDWLAVELQDSGWDLKHMLRLMVSSRAFRQNSARRDGIDDPENRLFARGPSYRMDAEVIRDIALWSSGLLDNNRGGEGIKPYQPPGMWLALAHPGSNTKNYKRDQGSLLYRRSLYVYWKRTSPHPMMTLFDAPSRESSCVRRSRTNTALQSLGLLNETQRVEMGRTFAQRLLQTHDDDAARLAFLFELLACRPPTESESAACLGLVKRLRDRYQTAEKDAVALLSIGDAPRDEKLSPAEHAAWTQLAITVLASDAAILLY